MKSMISLYDKAYRRNETVQFIRIPSCFQIIKALKNQKHKAYQLILEKPQEALAVKPVPAVRVKSYLPVRL